MAAVAAVLLPALKPGDVLVVPTDGYYVVRALAASHLAPRDVTVREVPTEEAAIAAALPGASLMCSSRRQNPGMDVVDIAALAEAAHPRARWSPRTTRSPPRWARRRWTRASTS